MFLNALKQQALQYPDQTALRGETTLWSWKQYLEAVVNAASLLHALGIRRLALELDNSPEWAIIDLACISVGIVIVPIPPFFSETQKEWVRASASIDAQIGGESMSGWHRHDFPFGKLQVRQLTAPTSLPVGTSKMDLLNNGELCCFLYLI